MTASPGRRPEGIAVRHSRGCATNRGGSCDCRPGYQAQVFSQRDQRTIRKTFRTLADARAWRAQTHSALRLGTMRAPTRTTVAIAAAEWLVAAKADVVRTRSGSPYKPSALRGYEQALRAKILPALGHLRLSSVTRPVLQQMEGHRTADLRVWIQTSVGSSDASKIVRSGGATSDSGSIAMTLSTSGSDSCSSRAAPSS
jgi:integrase